MPAQIKEEVADPHPKQKAAGYPGVNRSLLWIDFFADASLREKEEDKPTAQTQKYNQEGNKLNHIQTFLILRVHRHEVVVTFSRIGYSVAVIINCWHLALSPIVMD